MTWPQGENKRTLGKVQKNSLDWLSLLVEKTVTFCGRLLQITTPAPKSRALLSKFDGGTTEKEEEGNEEEEVDEKTTT